MTGLAPHATPGRFALACRAVRVVATAVVVLVPGVLAGLAHASLRGRSSGRRYVYRRLTALLTALGPAFVKAGQVLGTRRDVLPAALCDELSVLQDAVPPPGPAQTRRALAEAYAADPALTGPDGVFAEIDERPVAGGSVACVHRGVLATGEQVAIKVRRPDVDRVMARDLALVRAASRLVARLPMLRGVPVAAVVEDMCAAVHGQLDLAREADGLARLRDNLAVVPRVRVPKVYAHASRPRCVVMELIPELDVRTAAACPPATRRRLAASALTAIYQMLFVDGFVHCDLHPGNLYFTRDGQVVVLDAGFSVRLSERLRRLFAEFFLNMSVGRGRRCAEIVVESAAGTRPGADLDGFLDRMADLVERSHGLPAREFSLVAFATEMFALQRAHGVHAAPELIFPLLSLLVIEGTIRDLDPGIDFQETARPVLNRGLFGAR
ncbi:ABC1 kinase family protein [Actinomadura miaoliensis]|uniref:Ubiquinone biosynthesis regulatory protein kinase UbiB n=1 Tax=Actinomadura miaoliensis TaxID=430685 RepID=A0ABP7VQ07_9ACTN